MYNKASKIIRKRDLKWRRTDNDVGITGFGDKTTINYKNSKEVELMKLKLAKRGSKGTKLRV